MHDPIPVLLITGAPGAGKTALAEEIGEQLFHAKAPHAVIDLDQLARIRPVVPDQAACLDDFTVDNHPQQTITGLARSIIEHFDWPT